MCDHLMNLIVYKVLKLVKGWFEQQINRIQLRFCELYIYRKYSRENGQSGIATNIFLFMYSYTYT